MQIVLLSKHRFWIQTFVPNCMFLEQSAGCMIDLLSELSLGGRGRDNRSPAMSEHESSGKLVMQLTLSHNFAD